MKIQLKSFTVVGTWKYNIENAEECIICQNEFEVPCAKCLPGECDPVYGKCGHVFHLHCIQNWKEKKNTCPLCRQKYSIDPSKGLNA